MKVAKFGGSSLSNATQIKKVASIVQNDKDIKTIVVSAPGKCCDDDVKVTDMLITICTNKIAGLDTEEALTEILMRYKSMVEELTINSSLRDNYESIIRDYLNPLEDNAYLVDSLTSRGEDFNAHLISAYFTSLGISAKYVSPEEAGIRVTNTPANARLLPSSYNEINKLKDYPEDVLV